jgi:hypothetical protein
MLAGAADGRVPRPPFIRRTSEAATGASPDPGENCLPLLNILNDPKAAAADAKTARPTVIPFHQHLELVGVPDDSCASDPQIGLLDPVTFCRDVVSPLHAAPPSQ